MCPCFFKYLFKLVLQIPAECIRYSYGIHLVLIKIYFINIAIEQNIKLITYLAYRNHLHYLYQLFFLFYCFQMALPMFSIKHFFLRYDHLYKKLLSYQLFHKQYWRYCEPNGRTHSSNLSMIFSISMLMQLTGLLQESFFLQYLFLRLYLWYSFFKQLAVFI